MAECANRKSVDVGLFVLRLGIGAMFMMHGLPKLMAGPSLWKGLGGAAAAFGLSFAPVVWGLLAALAEFVGGLALMAGVLVRPFAAVMLGVMVVAAQMHIAMGHPASKWTHPVELGVVLLSLVIMGAGAYRCRFVARKPKPAEGTT